VISLRRKGEGVFPRSDISPTTVPPFGPPQICTLVHIDAALVIQYVVGTVITLVIHLNRYEKPASAKPFSIGGPILVRKEPIFQAGPKAALVGVNYVAVHFVARHEANLSVSQTDILQPPNCILSFALVVKKCA